MWNTPTAGQLAQIPGLYATENTPVQDKIIHLHFFFAGSDWFIAEFDGEDIFFGFAVLNNDLFNAEWGYISFSELKEIRLSGFEIDNDLHWQPCRAGEVVTICEAQGWQHQQNQKRR